MSLISIQDAGVWFGAEEVFRGVSCEVNRGDRIGLIGRNGAGKTTLLHVLSGDLKPLAGLRQAASSIRISLVEQVPAGPASDVTLEQEALSAFTRLINLELALEDAAAALSKGVPGADGLYEAAQDRLEHEGGFTYRARMAQVLTGLGLSDIDPALPVSALSGGQRSRLALAKALLAGPDLLLMDEPTNHLDLDGLRWLDGFLARWPGTLVVTSHDRYFLDRVATRIWHMAGGGLKAYRGNYTKSEAQRETDRERQEREFQAQQEFVAKEEAFIRRYGAGQRAREAKGREKKLARLQRVEAPVKERSAAIALKAQRSGDVVVSATGVAAGYGDVPLLGAAEFELLRGDRVALIGPNGSGKTTLLRTIAGDLPPVAGALRLGSNVTVAHYWQEAEDLDPTASVLDELLRGRRMDLQAARDHLGLFLFRGDDVFKAVSSLSGGERGRLALAKLVLTEANLLLLDEPTNHLDIESRESLQKALATYPGTLVFASHDRRLIADLATRLWVIEPGEFTTFDGTFEEYLDRNAAPSRAGPAAREARPRQDGKDGARRAAAAAAALEEEIHRREQDLVTAGERINDASARGDHRALAELGRRFDDLQRELETLIETWARTP